MELEKKCGIYKTYPIKECDREGGLRLKGKYKQSTDEYPLITYVTVVYNRVNTIMSCMESVWNQDYPNIEYIIVDGNSTDGTLELIEQNADKIDYYISQPDTGIYNAMNKGIALASGDFICFMNSDDQCMPGAARKVVEFYQQTQADIICGSRELAQNGKRVYEVKYPRYCIEKSVFRYVQMFHQSTYAKPEVFDKVGYFDESYSLLADWIWESGSMDAGFNIYFTDEELARFSYDGASCQGIYKRDAEWEIWAKKTFPYLKDKDAKFFIYCLDRGRHPLFDLKMLNRVASRYYEEEEFKRTYYETVLLACIEQCTDIALMKDSNDEYINKIIAKYKLNQKFGISGLDNLSEWLKKALTKVIDNSEKKVISTKEMEEIVSIRRCLNQVFYHLYMRRTQHEDASKIDRLLRVMCYTASKCASRSVFLSRKFYTVMRAVWYYSFKGRFVEN